MCTLESKMLQVFPLVKIIIGMNLERFWYGEIGEQDIPFQVKQFYLIHYFSPIMYRLGQVVEYLFHLLRGLKIKLVVGKCEPLVVYCYVVIRKLPQSRGSLLFAGIDAKQDIVGIEILLVYIMRIIGSDDFNVIFFRIFQQNVIHLFLFGYAVPL